MTTETTDTVTESLEATSYEGYEDSDVAARREIAIIGGGGLSAGLACHLSRHARILVIDGGYLPGDFGNALLQMSPGMVAEDRYAIRASKGKKSRWNRENRWR